MKKIFTIAIVLIISKISFAQDIDKSKLTFPLQGKFSLRQTNYIQFKEIEFWVYNSNDSLVYYLNNSVGTNRPKEMIMFSAGDDYISLMKKNGYFIREKKNFILPKL